MYEKCNAILVPAKEHKTNCIYVCKEDNDISIHQIDINYLPHHLYITVDEKVEEGDWGVGYAQGFRGRGAGHFLFKNDGTTVGKLNAICSGVSKVIAATNRDINVPIVSLYFVQDYAKKYRNGEEISVEYEEHYESGVCDCGSSDLWDSGSTEIRLRLL